MSEPLNQVKLRGVVRGVPWSRYRQSGFGQLRWWLVVGRPGEHAAVAEDALLVGSTFRSADGLQALEQLVRPGAVVEVRGHLEQLGAPLPETAGEERACFIVVADFVEGAGAAVVGAHLLPSRGRGKMAAAGDDEAPALPLEGAA